jgi:uncharacterized membrane protein
MPYPIKLSAKSEALPILTIIASIVFSLYFYSHFPERIITHWGYNGQPNGYGGKFFGSFGILFIIIGMYLLFLVLPMLDPHNDRYKEFEKPFHFFKGAIMLVILAIFIFSGLYNLGYHININIIVPLLVGILMILLGNYMGKIKRNWFMGIRTPWTLSSENVWNKTHRAGGVAFIIFGIILMLVPLLPKIVGIALFVVGILLIVLGTFVYSYLLYRKEKLFINHELHE